MRILRLLPSTAAYLALVAASLTAGCADDETPRPVRSSTDQSQDQQDAGPDSSPSHTVEQRLEFVPETTPAGATMFLEPAGTGPDGSVLVDVGVASDRKVYGVAGAIRFDSPEVEVVDVRSLHTLEGPDGVFAWHRTSTGGLVFAVTHRGSAPGSKLGSQAHVVRLTLKTSGHKEVSVSFVPKLCAVLDDDLRPTTETPSYRGGLLRMGEVDR